MFRRQPAISRAPAAAAALQRLSHELSSWGTERRSGSGGRFAAILRILAIFYGRGDGEAASCIEPNGEARSASRAPFSAEFKYPDAGTTLPVRPLAPLRLPSRPEGLGGAVTSGASFFPSQAPAEVRHETGLGSVSVSIGAAAAPRRPSMAGISLRFPWPVSRAGNISRFFSCGSHERFACRCRASLDFPLAAEATSSGGWAPTGDRARGEQAEGIFCARDFVL
ncbi:Hypothetical predicted protein [Podarcis lilfordi]|uniref:Uncharacterized protein n=1 Tax=Podarcis lilfordi TaxID=74358 RepID=A0AA35K696_9SAUR|nr:Hypothetical predicted protein [Podarcis lilfordi]